MGAAARVLRAASRFDSLPTGAPLLAVGNRRSYGDVCQNPGGNEISTLALDRFIAFDPASGILRAETGVQLADIIALCLPAGWFPAVTPGTRFVTLGGAIANDVHGKNHHRAGSFGSYVLSVELLRSDGQRLICSPTQNAGLFAATIGGLGLTGMMLWAEIQLARVPGPWLRQTQRRFHGLDEFVGLNEQEEQACEHVVSWIDCQSPVPRGIIISGNHVADAAPPPASSGTLGIPFTPPLSPVNRLTLKAFNTAYFHRPLAQGLVHYQAFFYPLDAILEWNRAYGGRGFYQYQCALPYRDGKSALHEILKLIASAGSGSFLAVLKTFADLPSPGLLSYPMAGFNLALDFPNRGAATERLFARIDGLVAEAAGRIYPAKDARMPAALFRQGYPQLERFVPFVDPAFSSGFWRRMMEKQ